MMSYNEAVAWIDSAPDNAERMRRKQFTHGIIYGRRGQMTWCKCKICGEEITPDDRFKLVSGWVTCMTHTTHERNNLRRTDSQAGEPQSGDGCLRPASKEQENG